MMTRPTFKDLYRDAQAEQLIRKERKALKRSEGMSMATMRVIGDREMLRAMERGWDISQVIPNGVGTNTRRVMTIARDRLEASLKVLA